MCDPNSVDHKTLNFFNTLNPYTLFLVTNLQKSFVSSHREKQRERERERKKNEREERNDDAENADVSFSERSSIGRRRRRSQSERIGEESI